MVAACGALAVGCGGTPPESPPPPPPEIRVEIMGDLPAGTRWIYAALIANPTYCEEYGDDSCDQVYQVEIDPSAGGTFRLLVPEALRTFEYNRLQDAGTGRALLRVEARADDHCILARGSRLVDKSAVALALTPPPERVCSVFMSVNSTMATMTYGDTGKCPAAPVSVWSEGVVCVTEQPKNTPLALKATTKSPGVYVFSRWDGFPDCAARAQPDCTLPVSGPAVVRAVFR